MRQNQVWCLSFIPKEDFNKKYATNFSKIGRNLPDFRRKSQISAKLWRAVWNLHFFRLTDFVHFFYAIFFINVPYSSAHNNPIFVHEKVSKWRKLKIFEIFREFFMTKAKFCIGIFFSKFGKSQIIKRKLLTSNFGENLPNSDWRKTLLLNFPKKGAWILIQKIESAAFQISLFENFKNLS